MSYDLGGTIDVTRKSSTRNHLFSMMPKNTKNSITGRNNGHRSVVPETSINVGQSTQLPKINIKRRNNNMHNSEYGLHHDKSKSTIIFDQRKQTI